MTARQVTIKWRWLDWQPNYTWAKEIVPQLHDMGLQEQQLDHCVYVIRANGVFAIKYPKKASPTLYIGEGNFKNRIMQHKNWLEPLRELVGDFYFQIGLCIPRVKNNYYAYKDFEAALLMEFREIYGCAPLVNKQMENRHAEYKYVPRKEIRSALMIGKGIRYHWELVPKRSSPYYKCYWKTQ